MDYFTTQDIAKTFAISQQTVKNWCDQFGMYLSPTATPAPGRRRMFSSEDLKVFALVNEFRTLGQNYEDAQAALAQGQRGEILDPNREVAMAVPATVVISLRHELEDVRSQLRAAETDRDKERGKTELLQNLLLEERELTRKLYQEIANLQAQKNVDKPS